MGILVSDLVVRVQKRLRMVSGVGVQVYAEDTIMHSIQTGFERLFLQRWWPHYTYWSTWTLDGTTGKVTTDISTLVKEFSDIRTIFYAEDKDPTPRLSASRNPNEITGTRARYWEPLPQMPTRVFRILPITTVGDVHVHYRTHPDDLALDTTVHLNPLLLELAAALDYLVSDNANPTFIDTVQAMLETHFNTIDAIQDDDEVEIGTRSEVVPTEWH